MDILSCPTIRNPQSAIRNRSIRNHSGVTLVELLITMAIISILAATLLGVAAVAGDTAREARTKNIIARLHTLLMEHYDTYKSRRVRLNPNLQAAINSRYTNATLRGAALAEARLYALREIMVMEIPDRWSDIHLNPGGYQLQPTLFLDVTGSEISRTPLAQTYYRRYLQVTSNKNRLTGETNTPDEVLANQGAECLFLVITLATGDGEARSLFGESVIGDTDGDGAPEFVDGWGNPIQFLRWAPGFESDLQMSANDFGGSDAAVLWQRAAASDHDPFDIYRRDPLAFRLVPLIYSAGADEELGIFDEPEYVTWRKPAGVDFNNSSPFIKPALTPYAAGVSLYANVFLGTTADPDAAVDNIHNHLIVGE